MLRIRAQNENDVPFLARLLRREAEHHSILAAAPVGNSDDASVNATDDAAEDAINARILNFLGNPRQGALIYEDEPGGGYAGAVIYRTRSTDEQFSTSEVFGRINLKALPTGQFIEIVLCWIHPDYRRMGLGRELLTCLEHEAHRRGIHLVYLQTEGKNIVGSRFARKMKYKEIFRGRVWDDVVRVGLIKHV